jgi:hypothetical protein
VEGNYRGKGKWYPGRINRVNRDGTVDIDYNDGEKETKVEESLVRIPLEPKSAKTSKLNSSLTRDFSSSKVSLSNKSSSVSYNGSRFATID